MTVRALGCTARRAQALQAEADELLAELERLTAAIAPWLLELFGVGPISAAQLLVSWSHAGRFRSEAAFAALAGANPIPACSGQVVRHRLNRSGDRQLNQALHTIALVRLRDDPETRCLRRPAHRRGQERSGYQALSHWGTIPVAARGSGRGFSVSVRGRPRCRAA